MRNLYSLIRQYIPVKWHSSLTLLLYLFRIKPTVNKKDPSPFTKGIIVISADFEMAWAFRYSKKRKAEAAQLGLQERKNIPRLIELFDIYGIPITWASVGHLFLDSCDRKNSLLPHPDLLRPSYFENSNWEFLSGDWYDHDPCSNHEESPAWYAPDLIDEICKSKVQHEIGCHTFSHIDCTNRNCSPDLFRQELEICIDLAAKRDLKLTSMVFPGGTLGNLSVLKQLGFLSYRRPTKYHVDLPLNDEHGLVQIPSSYAFERSNQNWKSSTYIRIAKMFVVRAAKYKMVSHFWFHPSLSEWYIENVLPHILSYIKDMQLNGKIEILTMAQLTKKILNNKKT